MNYLREILQRNVTSRVLEDQPSFYVTYLSFPCDGKKKQFYLCVF